MRTLFPTLALLVAGAVAVPLNAQENLVTLGIFVTVRNENLPGFEQGAREHNEWHASQNDPQPWVTYQGLTGSGEYAILAPDMTWASLDAPVVDRGTDVAHWAESGAQYVETKDVLLWRNIPGGNPPEDFTQYPLVQVYEFEINSGGQPDVMNVIPRATEALSRTGWQFQWALVLSADAPQSIFLEFFFRSFEDLGTPRAGPDQVMADAFGPGVGVALLNQFSEATTPKSTQIWMLRPDLSYLPEM